MSLDGRLRFFSWGRFGGGLVLGRTTFRILTALVESSDDGMIRRLQLEGFHVSSERVIEVGFVQQGDNGRSGRCVPPLCKCLRSYCAEAFIPAFVDQTLRT
jgi:hypothetical protein